LHDLSRLFAESGMPGLLVRSLYVDGGRVSRLIWEVTAPIRPVRSSSAGAVGTLTGTTGKQRHMGNLIATGKHAPESWMNGGPKRRRLEPLAAAVGTI